MMCFEGQIYIFAWGIWDSASWDLNSDLLNTNDQKVLPGETTNYSSYTRVYVAENRLKIRTGPNARPDSYTGFNTMQKSSVASTFQQWGALLSNHTSVSEPEKSIGTEAAINTDSSTSNVPCHRIIITWKVVTRAAAATVHKAWRTVTLNICQKNKVTT